MSPDTQPTQPPLTWSLAVFADCYVALQRAAPALPLLAQLTPDLKAILCVPGRSEASRTALARADAHTSITLPGGETVALNGAFLAASSALASELEMDELYTAELMWRALDTSFLQGSDAVEAATLVFFQRYLYIINILGHLVSERRVGAVLGAGSEKTLFTQILASFRRIYAMLATQNGLIDKERATADVNNLQFVNKTCYVKRQLFDLHDVLAQVLYALVDTHASELASYATYTALTTHINECVPRDDDVFLVHYMPVLARVVTPLATRPPAHVVQFHTAFTAELRADYASITSADSIDVARLSLRAYARIAQLMFFAAFVPWCKHDAARTTQYDFHKDILQQVEWLVAYGAFELLMGLCADTSRSETRAMLETGALLDFRALLLPSCVPMTAVQLLPHGAAEMQHAAKADAQLSNVRRLLDIRGFVPSREVCDNLLGPHLHQFLANFISHAAVVLTQLRDSEEDFLLSSINRRAPGGAAATDPSDDFNNTRRATHAPAPSEIDLAELATCAELERFHMACVYTYNHRPELCTQFWADDVNTHGFITWGLANNTSPLISATFCLLLGSLTFGSSSSGIGSSCNNSGGSSVRVWNILVRQDDGAPKKNDYLKISVDSILSSLDYYVGALNDTLEAELLAYTRRQRDSQDLASPGNAAPATVQLLEDSMAFVSGFFTLLTLLVENSGNDDAGSVMRDTAFSRVLQTAQAFLRFDNLVSAAHFAAADKKPRVVFIDAHNRTALLTLVFRMFGSFAKFRCAPTNCEIWTTVDRWLCHALPDSSSGATGGAAEPTRYAGVSLASAVGTPPKSELARLRAAAAPAGMKHAFLRAFCSVAEVVGFVELLARLLEAPPASSARPLLPFPADLGLAYRAKNCAGVWPYMDFLVCEVLQKSPALVHDLRPVLQAAVLAIVEASLAAVDWALYEDVGPAVLPTAVLQTPFADAWTASGATVPLAYRDFVRTHHLVAVVNYLFDERAARALFDILAVGDAVETCAELRRLVARALACVDRVLAVQSTYIRKLVPVLQDASPVPLPRATAPYGALAAATTVADAYLPPGVGTHGAKDFYDIMLINMTSVAQIALYVGSVHADVAGPALRIFRGVADAPVFGAASHLANDTLLHGNRLLRMLEGIDESDKIRFAFLQQLESPAAALSTKLSILAFLHSKLSGLRSISVAHFLLGFERRGGRMSLDAGRGVLAGLVAQLQTLVESAAEQYSPPVVRHGPAALTCLILRVLVALCRSPATARATLAYLRRFDLLEIFLRSQMRVDDFTVWNSQRFAGDVDADSHNAFVADLRAADTFLCFVETQHLVLQYVALELHNNTSQARREHYAALLLNGTEFFNGTPKILEFLDIFDFQMYNLEDYRLRDHERHYNLAALVKEVCGDAPRVDPALFDRVAAYAAQVTWPDSSAETDTPAVEADRVRDLLTRVVLVMQLKTLHSRALHSWAQLIQVLTKQDLHDKGTLVLQVMQIVLPKIHNDYYERNILFAEELMSLCLFLCDIYEQETAGAVSGSANSSHAHPAYPALAPASGNPTSEPADVPPSDQDPALHGLHRLLPLLRTCLAGLVQPGSSVALRADIYLVLHKFLQAGVRSKPMRLHVRACLLAARSAVDVVCNDCVHSEGILRITSIMCLELLVHLLNLEHLPNVVHMLAKNNSLALLTRSLTRADETISACGASSPKRTRAGVSVDALLYELTALKTTLYLLVRIAQTKAGAAQLVQNDIFPVLRRLQFLAVDVDLGMELAVDGGHGNAGTATLRLSLDAPLTIQNAPKTASGGALAVDGDAVPPDPAKTVSYYELFVPVFQLVATILLAAGPSYKPAVKQVHQLLQHYRPLVQGIMKRDTLSGKSGAMGADTDGLHHMARLFTLIRSLVDCAE